ncbi:MAG: hypothetical protein K9M54_13145 [Kiritimatiellales bacterium]|nr:hypothetical protein [Kiritimatiellales bacterium]MCF7864797.1 hypothetical protein [Kiritimatiellales bacterium]
MKKIILGLGCVFGICMVCHADIVVGLNAGGELWRADTADFNGTKQKLATLTAGTNYIDSAYDGTYLYGLRNDGAVYRSDAQGHVSQVAVSGWGSVKHISAKQGVLYGMTAAGAIKGVNGTTAVSAAVTGVWVDFSPTDDGKFWMLTTGDTGTRSYCYAFTNGYVGSTAGNVGFISQGNAAGIALDTVGTDLYVVRTYSTATAFYKNAVFRDIQGTAQIDLAMGTGYNAIAADGSVIVQPLTTGSRTLAGSFSGTGSVFVGLEVVPAPPNNYVTWAGTWGVDIGAKTNDYDGDGLSNVYEFGLGGDPTNNLNRGTSPEFAVVAAGGGSNEFIYVYPQLADPNSGLAYSLHTSTDLLSGIWTNAGYAITGTNVTGNALDFVTNVTNMVDAKKYIRLVIE